MKKNEFIYKYLKRFISADKVDYNDYKGNVKKYYRKKPKREVRENGIPQGGVLSGIIANIYMYDFDKNIKDMLNKDYEDTRYFRYADDFVILTKNEVNIEEIYIKIKMLINNKGLYLHEIGEKTKKLDVSYNRKDKLEFLGFEVSPKGIRVKRDNINKLKFKIKDKIDNTKIYKKNTTKGLEILINRINFKIIGNLGFEVDKNICEVCGKLVSERNWMSYYNIITDVRQLRRLDRWIRKQIYNKYYYCTKRRLDKELLINSELKSLEKLYYNYRSKKFLDSFCCCGNDHGYLENLGASGSLRTPQVPPGTNEHKFDI